jgi:hypothetical protein
VITFTIAPGTHSGPVSVDYCEVTVWSKKSPRVG